MIRAGVLGATGYAGIECVRLLAMHKEVLITKLFSHSHAGKSISDIYPNLRGVVDIICEELDEDVVVANCDVVFCALPHGVSKVVVPSLYNKGLKVIDLSGDFRYNDANVYKEWYGEEHPIPELLKESVYGLPEFNRADIAKTRLVGNPGCYTTCSITALAPLVANKIIDNKSIIIDAKSGVTGAGRSASIDYNFCEITESMKAYKIATHRHTSEIEQELSIIGEDDIKLSFTPHLVPMKRGILATCYANLTQKVNTKELVEIYKAFYSGEFFIRVLDAGKLPQTNAVAGSNFVDIGLVVDERLNRVIVVCAIDNLIKGAAGQAVQNMNILFGLDEKIGLSNSGYYI